MLAMLVNNTSNKLLGCKGRYIELVIGVIRGFTVTYELKSKHIAMIETQGVRLLYPVVSYLILSA